MSRGISKSSMKLNFRDCDCLGWFKSKLFTHCVDIKCLSSLWLHYYCVEKERYEKAFLVDNETYYQDFNFLCRATLIRQGQFQQASLMLDQQKSKLHLLWWTSHIHLSCFMIIALKIRLKNSDKLEDWAYRYETLINLLNILFEGMSRRLVWSIYLLIWIL